MGYYTGSGQTASGGETVNLRETGPDIGGAYYVYQRTRAIVTQKLGVSLSTAKAERGDMNLTYYQWPGGMVTPACRGTRKSVAYSQINGSNLYALNITDETIEVRGKQGTFDSGWIG